MIFQIIAPAKAGMMDLFKPRGADAAPIAPPSAVAPAKAKNAGRTVAAAEAATSSDPIWMAVKASKLWRPSGTATAANIAAALSRLHNMFSPMLATTTIRNLRCSAGRGRRISWPMIVRARSKNRPAAITGHYDGWSRKSGTPGRNAKVRNASARPIER